MQTIGDRERDDALSLYVHLPFCTKKCPYCHFYVIPDKPLFQERLLEGLLLEWARVKDSLTGKQIPSLYFGGGTPALFSEENFETLAKYLPFDAAEVTIEANPETLSEEKLKFFKGLGINRLSIGIQAFDDALLKRLGRTHDARHAYEAVLKANHIGFDNISIDLMYDLPGQTVKDWERSLDRALELPISHLSLYNLTIEPHTSFYKRREALKKQIPSEEASHQMYSLAIDRLENGGLKQYEISAFAKEDRYSRHNTGYWLGRPFYGLGPSAFSYINGARFQNEPNLNRYLDRLKKGEHPVSFSEKLDKTAYFGELLMIGLRLKEGINLGDFEQKKGKIPQNFWEIFQKLEKKTLLARDQNHVFLTQKGVFLYNLVAEEFVDLH